MAHRVDPADRTAVDSAVRELETDSRFTFPGRRGKYSSFCWDATCFSGTSHMHGPDRGIWLLDGHHWAEDVDREYGNYDYLMGMNIDHSVPAVRQELLSWGKWYLKTTGAAGFRLDAVKHISAGFYREWLRKLRNQTGKEIFAVGEYWNGDCGTLLHYLQQTEGAMSLFDVPLHYHLREASSSGGAYDMRRMFENTLVGSDPVHAVTFVDNHDTQPTQSLESWVEGWFKAAAYGLILLRAFGYPCVFWGDLMGIPHSGIGAVSELPQLLGLRRDNAWGEEHDVFDDADLLAFTREGDDKHASSGLAFLCTNRSGGEKRLYVGKQHRGERWRCAIGGRRRVTIDAEGFGRFGVGDGSAAVYVPPLTLRALLQRLFRRLTGH